MTEGALVEIVGKALGALGAIAGVAAGLQKAREKRREARERREAARRAELDDMRGDLRRFVRGFLRREELNRERDRFFLDLFRRALHAMETGDHKILHRILDEEVTPFREGLYVMAGCPPRGRTYDGRERVERLLRGESVDLVEEDSE